MNLLERLGQGCKHPFQELGIGKPTQIGVMLPRLEGGLLRSGPCHVQKQAVSQVSGTVQVRTRAGRAGCTPPRTLYTPATSLGCGTHMPLRTGGDHLLQLEGCADHGLVGHNLLMPTGS